MKNICLSVLILLGVNLVYSQPQRWRTIGNIGKTAPVEVLSDKNGNLYACGSYFNDSLFRVMGMVSKWDGNKWREIGSFNKPVRTFVLDKNNNLYVAGEFGYVAKWNGTEWTQPGFNHNGAIDAMCVDSKNNIYVAGSFSKGSEMYVAMYDGADWYDLGRRFSYFLNALSTDPDNNLYVGGSNQVSKYDGTTWSTLPNWNGNGNINALCNGKDGNLYAGGSFTDSMGNTYLAKWDGNEWSAMTNGEKMKSNSGFSRINCLAIDKHNDIYAAGKFEKSGTNIVMKWSNNEWAEVVNDRTYGTSYFGTIESICIDTNDVLSLVWPGVSREVWQLKPEVKIPTSNPVKLEHMKYKIYPNPASTLLYIDIEKPGYFTAKLSAITGQSITTTSNGVIDVSGLANGVYILAIYDSNNQFISTNKVAIIN